MAEMLKFIEKSLNGITVFVECSTVVFLFFAVLPWQKTRLP